MPVKVLGKIIYGRQTVRTVIIFYVLVEENANFVLDNAVYSRLKVHVTTQGIGQNFMPIYVESQVSLSRLLADFFDARVLNQKVSVLATNRPNDVGLFIFVYSEENIVEAINFRLIDKNVFVASPDVILFLETSKSVLVIQVLVDRHFLYGKPVIFLDMVAASMVSMRQDVTVEVLFTKTVEEEGQATVADKLHGQEDSSYFVVNEGHVCPTNLLNDFIQEALVTIAHSAFKEGIRLYETVLQNGLIKLIVVLQRVLVVCIKLQKLNFNAKNVNISVIVKDSIFSIKIKKIEDCNSLWRRYIHKDE